MYCTYFISLHQYLILTFSESTGLGFNIIMFNSYHCRFGLASVVMVLELKLFSFAFVQFLDLDLELGLGLGSPGLTNIPEQQQRLMVILIILYFL